MDTSAYLEHHIDLFRRGDGGAAFFGLVGSGRSLVAPLVNAFRSETDSAVKAFLVEVLWQQRDPSAIPVLGEALHDNHQQVWQEALNGLVTLASRDAIKVMQRARLRGFQSEKSARQFLVYLEEAIEQAEAALGT